MSEALGSTPSFSDFDPTVIPYQADVINAIDHDLDYSLGLHAILLSGSVGSAKSILMAHCVVKHCIAFKRARVMIGRQAMPDLRDTIYTKILEHIEGTVLSDGSIAREGKHFGFTDSTCGIWFANKSEIVARSWHDKKFKKLGSLEFSAAAIEELTENEATHWPAISYIRSRVGRLPHVPHSWILYATNPDAPSHPAYDYFQIGERQAGRTAGLKPTRHVYFSKTVDNPFLPSWYIEGLRNDLDPKMVLRLVEGHWIEIKAGVIYHAYSTQNFRHGRGIRSYHWATAGHRLKRSESKTFKHAGENEECSSSVNLLKFCSVFDRSSKDHLVFQVETLHGLRQRIFRFPKANIYVAHDD